MLKMFQNDTETVIAENEEQATEMCKKIYGDNPDDLPWDAESGPGWKERTSDKLLKLGFEDRTDVPAAVPQHKRVPHPKYKGIINVSLSTDEWIAYAGPGWLGTSEF